MKVVMGVSDKLLILVIILVILVIFSFDYQARVNSKGIRIFFEDYEYLRKGSVRLSEKILESINYEHMEFLAYML